MSEGAPWPAEGLFHTYFRYGGRWFQVVVFAEARPGRERQACVYPATDEAVAAWTAEQFQQPEHVQMDISDRTLLGSSERRDWTTRPSREAYEAAESLGPRTTIRANVTLDRARLDPEWEPCVARLHDELSKLKERLTKTWWNKREHELEDELAELRNRAERAETEREQWIELARETRIAIRNPDAPREEIAGVLASALRKFNALEPSDAEGAEPWNGISAHPAPTRST